ncbi:lecithin retinol acyltransferase family protein [Psychrobacter lutiphocae]|uniref:lecithin retinol acyltransferase family protein n=1 Tax=Psychrobacter lutiphocae TaxID=540500 RepID=UPI0003711B90|nr:lecithin retinol acyltransferase family protein [Psychrobacter lutiphocae]
MDRLKVGTHIKVNRLGYTHHGIYIGDGQVVHYSGFSEMFKKGEIALTTLDDFLGNQERFYIVEYSSSEVVYSPDEIVERALSRVGEDDYNLMFNNCEHFACWCVTGKHKSKQVDSVMVNATTTAMLYSSYQAYKTADTTKNAMYAASALTGINTGRQVANCAKGAVTGAAIGSALAGSATTVGLTTAVAATAPVSLPVVAVVGVGAVVGSLLGGLFD